jgi:hypothetical protein
MSSRTRSKATKQSSTAEEEFKSIAAISATGDSSVPRTRGQAKRLRSDPPARKSRAKRDTTASKRGKAKGKTASSKKKAPARGKGATRSNKKSAPKQVTPLVRNPYKKSTTRKPVASKEKSATTELDKVTPVLAKRYKKSTRKRPPPPPSPSSSSSSSSTSSSTTEITLGRTTVATVPTFVQGASSNAVSKTIDPSVFEEVAQEQANVVDRLSATLPTDFSLEAILDRVEKNKTLFGTAAATTMFKKLSKNDQKYDNEKKRLEARLFAILEHTADLKELCKVVQDPEQKIRKVLVRLFYIVLRGLKTDVKRQILNNSLFVFSLNLYRKEYNGKVFSTEEDWVNAQYESTTLNTIFKSLFAVFSENGIIFRQRVDFPMEGMWSV